MENKRITRSSRPTSCQSADKDVGSINKEKQKPSSLYTGISSEKDGSNVDEKTSGNKMKQDISKGENDETKAMGIPSKRPLKTKVSRKGTKKSKLENKEIANIPDLSEVKTVVIIKGKTAVDSACLQKIKSAHVYMEGTNVWDAMLNQTNLQFNNNKFYLMQLLQDDNMKNFSVWFRWGRVGKQGQNSLIACGSDLEKAKATFSQKFKEKTKNDWAERDNFEKVPGKYDLLQIDLSTKDEFDKQPECLKPVAIPESNLQQQIQDFIKMICDIKSMEDMVIEMQYDVKKSPLGKLNPVQIKAGYNALKSIEKLIKSKNFGSKLLQACNDFYTRIPHNFGMKRPPLITTDTEICEKLQLLEALGDIEIAMKILNSPSTMIENPVDRQYRLLNCNLVLVDEASEDYNMIKIYIENTQAPTHNSYRMKIINIFKCQKSTEDENFVDYGNKMLLWHGSRMTNWASIVGRGLRIAPPEAPHTGYMFGKGVYFADMSSKSANYCYPSRRNKNGVMLLCEVSLGNCNELLDADFHADKLPSGKHSVKGLGKMVPDPKQDIKLQNGTVVPQGHGIETAVENKNGYTLNYNEYVVYNTNQILMRYLVNIQFQFK